MDKEEKLRDGRNIVEVGRIYYSMLKKFHKSEHIKELQKLLQTDEEFQQLNKDMMKLGDDF
jgi:hypothetical protein